MVKDIDALIRAELPWVNSNMGDIVTNHLGMVNEGAMNDINNIPQSYFYRYLTAAMKALKPKQVVELGSAGGASALMMLATLPKDSQLIACSLPEPEIEFRFIEEGKYPNLTMIHGDDLDLDVWKGVDLHETDVWFIDTDHTYEQLHKELTLYDRFFKKGTIVLLDDIRLNEGMQRAWDEIKYDKLSLPDLHWSGYGMFQV